MKKTFTYLRTLLVSLLVLGATGAWAAGYTRTLNDEITVAGYKFKAFYDFQKNDPAVLPETGDLRYRSGDIWGLHNFGSGTRSATATIPVAEGDIIVIQHYSSTISTINCGKLDESLTASAGYEVYKISTTADDITFTIARYGGLIAAVVMEKDADAESAPYTINYLNGGSSVKTVTGEAVVGGSVVTEASFVADDVKYFREEGEPATLDIVSGTNTFNISVRQAETYSWTASSNVGTFTASGSAIEGENINISYPLYILDGGKLWTKAANSSVFNQTYVANENNAAYELTYTETDIEAIFYTEAEDVAGMDIVNSGNAEARSSQRAAAWAGSENIVFTTLPAGKYKLVGSYYSPTSGGGHPVIYAGNRIIVEATTGNANATSFNGEFVLAKDNNDIAFGKGGSKTAAFDYVYIQKLEDPTPEELAEATKADYDADNFTITIGSEGWATVYTDRALDFSSTGLTAYTATTDGTTVTLTEVTEVAAGTGVVLKGDAKSYIVPVIAKSDTEKGQLKGSATAALTFDAEAANDYYMLVLNSSSKAQFKKLSSGTIAAGKAYLAIAKSTEEARVMNVVFAGTTAIKAIETVAADNNVYNLAGQRVAAPQKGLYIVNGKKVIVK